MKATPIPPSDWNRPDERPRFADPNRKNIGRKGFKHWLPPNPEAILAKARRKNPQRALPKLMPMKPLPDAPPPATPIPDSQRRRMHEARKRRHEREKAERRQQEATITAEWAAILAAKFCTDSSSPS